MQKKLSFNKPNRRYSGSRDPLYDSKQKVLLYTKKMCNISIRKPKNAPVVHIEVLNRKAHCILGFEGASS